MKKKIKDLTLEEVHNLCQKFESCSDCPLCVDGDEYRGILLCDPEPLKNPEEFNKEIEVDD